MKKLILAAVLSATAFAATAADTVRFGTSATYPPFESVDANNQIVGFDIDLANALCKQMQETCTFTNQPFDGLIPALKFRRFDVIISGMDITEERSKQVTFTQPYYANTAMIIGPKGKFSSIADLKGKRVGLENGTTHQKYLMEKHPEITTVGYDSYQNAILDLKSGRLDGLLGDTAVLSGWLKSNPNLGEVGELIKDPQYFGTGVGMAVRPDNKELLAKLNTALEGIKANGEFKKINDKWFPAN